MELALKWKTCPCVLRASPISPLALIMSAVGSNDSNRISTPHCYLAVTHHLGSVLWESRPIPQMEHSLCSSIRSCLCIILAATFRICRPSVPLIEWRCTKQWCQHHSFTAISNCGVVGVLWCGGCAVGGAPSAGRATSVAVLLGVCCYMLRQHLAMCHH
jgi:hypothetical protein